MYLWCVCSTPLFSLFTQGIYTHIRRWIGPTPQTRRAVKKNRKKKGSPHQTHKIRIIRWMEMKKNKFQSPPLFFISLGSVWLFSHYPCQRLTGKNEIYAVCVCRDRIDTYECAVWRDPPVQGSIRTSNCNARAQAPRGYSTVFLLCFWRRAQEPEFQTGKQFFYLSLYIIVSTFFFLCFVLKRHKKKKRCHSSR